MKWLGLVAVAMASAPAAAGDDWTPINGAKPAPPQRFERVNLSGPYLGALAGSAAFVKGQGFKTFGLSQGAPAPHFALPAMLLDLAGVRRLGGDAGLVLGYGGLVNKSLYGGAEIVAGFGRVDGRLRQPINPTLGMNPAANPLSGVAYWGRQNTGAYGALRARFGLSVADDRLLFFAFGGLAVADTSARGRQLAPTSGVVLDPAGQAGAGAPPLVGVFEKRGVAVGWTAGLGAEAALTGALALRAEASLDGFGAPRATIARGRLGVIWRP